MKDSGYLKTSCQHCGGHLEYPADAAGSEIACPHCGWNTVVGEPWEEEEEEETEESPSSRGKWILILVAVAILGAGIFLGLSYLNDSHTTTPPPPAPPNLQEIILANLKNRGFHVSSVQLATTEGTTLTYGVGTVHNQSNQQRYGLKILLKLLDKEGQAIGEASDYHDALPADATWNFKALILNSSTASVRVEDILEDQ